jgi:flagellar hook-associated protein 1
MTSIFSSLQLGVKSFEANKLAIDITGHNIANVNTPGYSKQEVVLSASQPMQTFAGLVGNGVEINSIKQIRNEFLEKDIQQQLTKYGYSLSEKSAFEQVESVLNNDSDTSLSIYITNFFNNFEDLSLSPENDPTRESLLYSAKDLAERIKGIRSELNDQRTTMNLAVKDSIDEINTRLKEIADLNLKIIEAKPTGNANDYIDQRTSLLQELSQKVDVSYFIESNGSMTIMLGGGISLLTRGSYNSLEGVQNADNNGFYDVYVNEPGIKENVTDKINSGELGASLDVRDNKLPGYIDDIDQFAKTMITEINKVHSDGFGLTNFTVLSGTYSVQDPDIALNDPSNYQDGRLLIEPQAGSFNVTVVDPSGNKVITTIDVDPSESLNDLIAKVNAISNISATLDVNNSIEITSDTGYEFALSKDSSNVLASLGLNTFFDGSDGSNISINEVITNDISKIAASTTGVAGDGDNALELASMRNTKLFQNSTSTFTDYYSVLVSTAGSDSSVAKTGLKASESSLEVARNMRDSVSGVSTDEELSNLLMYQRSYDASAKFISVINEMIDVLINQIGLG